MRPISLKAIVFILEAGNFASELKYYIQDLTAREGVLRADSEVILIGCDSVSLKNYHNKISGLPASSPHYSIIGSDDVSARHEISQLIVKPCMSFRHYSVIDAGGSYGVGSIIMPGVVIGPKVVFAQYVLCKANSTIGANVQIGECSVVGQNASVGANTKIGDRVHVGPGVVIKENLFIGNDVKIDAGKIVIKNIGDINEP